MEYIYGIEKWMISSELLTQMEYLFRTAGIVLWLLDWF